MRDDNRDDNGTRTREQVYAGYILMPKTSTYALGVHALQQACQQEQNARHPQFVRPDGSMIYRPLTFKETIQARVESYERCTPEDRLKLFNMWQDSCTGIATQARSTKFKVIPTCEQLITIAGDFRDNYLPVNYATISAPELDSARRGAKFNQLLTPNEVEEQEGWRTALEDDLPLLRGYRDIVWDASTQQYGKSNKLMGFYVGQNTEYDELRALFVDDLNNDFVAFGGGNLYNNSSFLRVAP